jgi:hypothetical protein
MRPSQGSVHISGFFDAERWTGAVSLELDAMHPSANPLAVTRDLVLLVPDTVERHLDLMFHVRRTLERRLTSMDPQPDSMKTGLVLVLRAPRTSGREVE